MKWRRDERGAAAVEMALVLPILCLMVFGIAEFGFAFNRYISVTHAARDGVRRFSLGETAANAELAAEAATPELAGSVACTASQPTTDQVQMLCSYTYNFSLYIITTPIDLESTALMRKE